MTRTRKKIERQPPTFLAIDGEGRNVAGVGSEHLYTLLMASDGACYENQEEGLSTYECLTFLLDCKIEHPHDVFVAFAFNYDVNMLLREVPRATLERLWRMGRAIFYAGTAMYRLSYVPSKWFGVTEVEYAREPERDKHGRLFYRKIAVKGRSVRVWDVWGFFQKKFTSVLDEWLPGNPLTYGIAQMKEQRGDFTPESAEDIRTYCLNECRLLVQVMDKLARALWDAGLPLTSWLGAGAIASTMLKQHGIKDTLEWDAWPQSVKDASLWAYFGGRVEIFQQGILPETVYDYDIRSAYPATIATLPNVSTAEWVYDDFPVEMDPYDWGMIHVRWDTRGHALDWLAPFPQHFESGKVGWEAVGEGWYHVAEWRAAKRLFGNSITEVEAWYLLDEPDEKPFIFVRNVYETRAAYKAAGDPRHYPLKVGMNSLYGKLAQSMARDEEKRPPYQNFFLAGAVTAATRAKVLEALAIAGRAYAVMSATDGVFLTGYSAPNGVTPFDTSDRLGGWEISSTPPGMVLVQPGVFWERPGEGRTVRSRTRGFGAKSVSYEDAASLFTNEKTEHVYHETRFIGLGYCVNTGDWSNWRRWLDVERKLSRSLEPHRDTSMLAGYESRWRYVYPGTLHDPAKRSPYKTRGDREKAPDPERIEALQEAEQPEGAGA